ncbi:hypothetical protein FD35_GL000265 [Furfurilactobacillus rossiae DSM 15814]|uniref:Uncharacterized protein n=1 Tax=Furfurilactobacillus rossiae DSM 15814 TaxID=1114972 RepID=A0A0R1RKE9_9LACO|nr:hypothetical protein FD35_GL000265 [Furfurilactobacillus rossiae DSM 15814]
MLVALGFSTSGEKVDALLPTLNIAIFEGVAIFLCNWILLFTQKGISAITTREVEKVLKLLFIIVVIGLLFMILCLQVVLMIQFVQFNKGVIRITGIFAYLALTYVSTKINLRLMIYTIRNVIQ